MGNVKKDSTLVEQTQRNVLKYIADRSYEVNSSLPKEQELADILGVSRVVVREALSRIRALGFIETKKKKGTVVIMPEIFGVLKLIVGSGILNKESLKELYELRLMLEIGMADFIFRNKTEAGIKIVEDIVFREMEATTTEESIALDIQFHSTLYSITGNKGLQDFQNLLAPLFKYYAPRTKDYRDKQIVSHRGLLEVLRTGTADSFRLAMRMHLNTQFEHMSKILDDVQIPNGKEREYEKLSTG
jgi:DNA-binding FadR family transcriptional regulator